MYGARGDSSDNIYIYNDIYIYIYIYIYKANWGNHYNDRSKYRVNVKNEIVSDHRFQSGIHRKSPWNGE